MSARLPAVLSRILPGAASFLLSPHLAAASTGATGSHSQLFSYWPLLVATPIVAFVFYRYAQKPSSPAFSTSLWEREVKLPCFARPNNDYISSELKRITQAAQEEAEDSDAPYDPIKNAHEAREAFQIQCQIKAVIQQVDEIVRATEELARSTGVLPKDWADECVRKVRELLQPHKKLELSLSVGWLITPDKIADACSRWHAYACRQGSVHAVAVMAAACRVCPDGLPSGTADFWETQLFSLLGEGEGCYLLGLSGLLLYAHFHKTHERVALTAWRQAVRNFRRGGFTGHKGSMIGAHLLAFIGHDVPFDLPDDFKEPIPTDGPPGDLEPEAFYWCWRLAEAGDGLYADTLGNRYDWKDFDTARAEYWLLKSMEAGYFPACIKLGSGYENGQYPDETGDKGAICLILFTLWQHVGQEDKRLSIDEVAKLTREGGKRIGPRVAACKENGEVLYQRLSRIAEEKERIQENLLAGLYNEAGRKLNTLCATLPPGSPCPGKGTSVAGQARPRSSAGPDTPAKTDKDAPRAKPQGRAPAQKDASRRSLARPDKR